MNISAQLCFLALLLLKNVLAIASSDLLPSRMFSFFFFSFPFPCNEHNKKCRNVTSGVKIQTPIIVHCLHLYIRFSEAVFSSICWKKKIHTNEIQAQSVNNNEKVNSFYRQASACKTSFGMMVMLFCCTDHKAITVFQN